MSHSRIPKTSGHWTESDTNTGITNFDVEKEDTYLQAITEYNKRFPSKSGNIFIVYSSIGDKYGDSMYSLHANQINLSNFWRVYKMIKLSVDGIQSCI